MARPKPKKVDKAQHRGCGIEIRWRDTDCEVVLDGKPLHIERDDTNGSFRAPEQPYMDYGTPREIAEAVIERRQEESKSG